MKSLKFLAAAAMLAGALIQQAAAATTPHIYITGSTAFRAGTITAINTLLHFAPTNITGHALAAGGGTGNDTTYSAANPPLGQSATGTDNTTFIWEGGWITNADSSTTFVTVCATFTGSSGGIETCQGSLAIPFLSDGSTGTNNQSAYVDSAGSIPNLTTFSYTDLNGVTRNGNYSPSVLFVPQLDMADSFQASTIFSGGTTLTLGSPYGSSNNGQSGTTNVTFATANDNPIGFVTFKWLASKNFPLGTQGSTDQGSVFGSGYRVSSVNVNSNALINLFTGGSMPLSQLTGSTTGLTGSDQTVQIFATGRNFDSGTRCITFADSEIGITTAVLQYHPSSSGGVVTSHVLYPVESIDGVSTVTPGNSGEASGGTLRAFLALTLPNSGLADEGSDITQAYYITYLGTADASNAAVLGIGTELSYKGVPFSTNGIYQGQYSFWSVEHVLDRGDLTGVPARFRDNLVSTLNGFPSTNFSKAGISNLDVTNNVFQASRATDGGLISVTFNP